MRAIHEGIKDELKSFFPDRPQVPQHDIASTLTQLSSFIPQNEPASRYESIVIAENKTYRNALQLAYDSGTAQQLPMLERTVSKFPLKKEACSSYLLYRKKPVNELQHAEEIENDVVVSMCRRSVRNLPYSAAVWLHLARALKRSAPSDKAHDELYALLEHTPLVEYGKISMGPLDVERRQCRTPVVGGLLLDRKSYL